MDMKQKKGNKTNSTIGIVVVMMLVAVIIVTMYSNLTKQGPNKEGATSESDEVELLLGKDLEENYPATPREVVKLYLRIMTCFYNEELERESLEGLARQTLLLFDQELVDNNPWEDYLERLMIEIKQYQEQQKVIDRYELEKGSAVRHYTKEGQEYASIQVEVVSRDEQLRYRTSERFILRKAEDGTYKILGWQIIEDADLDEH